MERRPGVSLHDDRSFYYAGVSCPKLTRRSCLERPPYAEHERRRHFFVSLGRLFAGSSTLQLLSGAWIGPHRSVLL